MQDRKQTCHAHGARGARRSTKYRSTCNYVSGHPLPTPKRPATYRSGELLWLGCLPALLADRRQGGVDSGYVVGGEAPVQLPTHVARVGAGRLGAKGAAQRRGEAEASERRLLLAGGAKTAAVANAGGKGHGQLEIHCTMVSTSGSRIIHHHECGVGGGEGGVLQLREVRLPSRTAHTAACPATDRGRTYTDKLLEIVLVHWAGALGGRQRMDANESYRRPGRCWW